MEFRSFISRRFFDGNKRKKREIKWGNDALKILFARKGTRLERARFLNLFPPRKYNEINNNDGRLMNFTSFTR